MISPDWIRTWAKLDSDAQCVQAILCIAAIAIAAGALFYLGLDTILVRLG